MFPRMLNPDWSIQFSGAPEYYGRLPFDQKFRGDFPEISMGKWYSLFPVWKTIIACLEFFIDFQV